MQTNISTYIQANIIIIYLFFLGVFLITATFAFLVENDQCGDHLQRNSGMWPYINDKIGGGGALCFEWGFTRTFPGNQDATLNTLSKKILLSHLYWGAQVSMEIS